MPQSTMGAVLAHRLGPVPGLSTVVFRFEGRRCRGSGRGHRTPGLPGLAGGDVVWGGPWYASEFGDAGYDMTDYVSIAALRV